MNTLFPEENRYPEGFNYIPDFISTEEEGQLLDIIHTIELKSFLFQGFEAKRRVASFGYDYSFDKRQLTKGAAIPTSFQPLLERVAFNVQIQPSEIAELLITEYPVGAVINWHRDAPPFDVIAGVSLRADCTFKLRPHERERQSRKSIINIPVARRSLYIMRGPARSEWQHSTAPVPDVRYSITFRTLDKVKVKS